MESSLERIENLCSEIRELIKNDHVWMVSDKVDDMEREVLWLKEMVK